MPFIWDAFLFQLLKIIPWRFHAERALHYGWHCVCKVSFCMFTLWLAVRSKRNHYYSHVLIHCLNASAKIKSQHHSNHLIKTEEFIGNDLHKVHIKSVPSQNQPLQNHWATMKMELVILYTNTSKKVPVYEFIFQTVLCNFIDGARRKGQAMEIYILM